MHFKQNGHTRDSIAQTLDKNRLKAFVFSFFFLIFAKN